MHYLYAGANMPCQTDAITKAVKENNGKLTLYRALLSIALY